MHQAEWGRSDGAGEGVGGSGQKPPKTWRLAVIKKWHQVIIIQICDCISQNSADGILSDGSAKNILADTALSLWFTRHTRAPLQEGDPAWALAQLQVNAQLKVAAAAVLRQGVPWRRALPRRLFPNYLSIVNRGNLKKNTHIKSKQNLDKIWLQWIQTFYEYTQLLNRFMGKSQIYVNSTKVEVPFSPTNWGGVLYKIIMLARLCWKPVYSNFADCSVNWYNTLRKLSGNIYRKP